MADHYVDNATGSDAGAGTSGDPWETLQHALDTASAGDTIHVSNSQIEVLSSSLDIERFAAGASPTTIALPLRLTVWDRGGSVTATMPDGSTIPAWGIDGDNTVANVWTFSSASTLAARYFSLQCCVIENFTGDLGLGTNTVLSKFEVDNVNSVVTYNVQGRIGFGRLTDTVSHGVVASQSDWDIDGVRVINAGGRGMSVNSSRMQIRNCLIENPADEGVYIAQINCTISRNTIVGATTGIIITGSRDGTSITDNVIADCTTGINDVTSAVNSQIIGRNAFWDNTTDETINGTVISQPDNVVEVADPFTNAAGGDYTIKSSASCYDADAWGEPLGVTWKAAAAGGGNVIVIED